MEKKDTQYDMGYKAGLQEGRSRERDKWMPKYDNLLKQWQDLLVAHEGVKQLYDFLYEDFMKLLQHRRRRK
jgi:hypothetical protein